MRVYCVYQVDAFMKERFKENITDVVTNFDGIADT